MHRRPRLSRMIVVLVLAFAATGAVATAGPLPGTVPIKPVYDKADLVCSCAVVSTDMISEHQLGTSAKPLLRREILATVLVQASYKGGIPAGTRVRVAYSEDRPITDASGPALHDRETALLFLQLARKDVYVIADGYIGVTPFHVPLHQSSVQGLKGLELALDDVLGAPDRSDLFNAMHLLQGLPEPSPHTVDLLMPLSQSADGHVAIAASAVLMRTKRPEHVELLERALRRYGQGDEPFELISVGTEISRIRDRKAFSVIKSLSSSPFFSIRSGAMQALRAFKDPNAAQVLIGRLDDENSYIRYLAVITLAETFDKGADYAPSMFLFDQRPQHYIELWKRWWVSEGRQQYSNRDSEPASPIPNF